MKNRSASSERRAYCQILKTGILLYVILSQLLNASTVEPPSGECEGTFLQDLYTCFTNHSVSFNTYMWAVGNKTVGTPPDNETAFKIQMCSVEEPVIQCSLNALQSSVKTDKCRATAGIDTLLTEQVQSIFQDYDTYCAHECRVTLENDMKSCYRNLTLDPELFLSKSSEGALLGKTASDVEKFCNNKEELMTCLKQQALACPESAYVMRRLGLDFATLDAGLKILCRKQDVYLSSLECFGIQTRAVEKCQEDSALALRRMAGQTKSSFAQDKDKFINEFCQNRLIFIKCDLTSWASKDSQACNTAALAMKRDLHCSQIPEVCFSSLREPIEKLCKFDWAKQTPEAIQGHSTGSCITKMNFVAFNLAMLARFTHDK